MGITKHTDNDFLTVLLQDQIGGLKVRCDDGKWANVPPVPGALVGQYRRPSSGMFLVVASKFHENSKTFCWFFLFLWLNTEHIDMMD